MPGGRLELEWAGASSPPGKSAVLLQEELAARFQEDPAAGLLFLGFSDAEVPLSDSLEFWRRFSSLFAQSLTRTPGLELLRHRALIPFEPARCAALLEQAPLMTGAEYLGPAVLERLWGDLNRSFCASVKGYDGTVEAFLKNLSPRVHLVGRVFFHLVENRKGPEPFAFLATYSTRLGKGGTEKHLPLKAALQEYGGDRKKLLELLSTVQQASQQSAIVARLMESGELFHPLAWSAAEAFAFLREVPVYEASGILCRIPDWWKGARAGVRLNIGVGETRPSHVSAAALMNFRPSLFLGDEEISLEEARNLLLQSEGLAFIKNRWVAVDPERLRKTIEAFQEAERWAAGTGVTLAEAMRLQLQPERMLGEAAADGVDLGVSNGTWLASVIDKMRNPARMSPVTPARSFRARLREYQQSGLNWLAFLNELGFGACLADDMGLGKTVQVLALLDVWRTREGGERPNLLVLPASLVSNWASEIGRFAPEVRFFIAHPHAHPDRAVPEQGPADLQQWDLVITTYGLVRKTPWIQAARWNCVILDEAQAIKNPGAQQTRAIKKLRAASRIVMTGTPVENSLGDLWSLFDFLNPGLLGTAREFNGFARELRKDPSGYARLRNLVGPYILRRLKTDKTVISDLPEKVEMKTYASLTRKQVLLYQQAVTELARTLAEVQGIQRKGVVLATLMKLKQLCNHPDQYLGTGDYEEADSGKFARLREVSETIREKRERVLVFTQFREITGPLSGFLETLFGRPGLVLHGGVPVGQRRKLVERFQGAEYVPFLVLSLKAGGVGLNLTAANHVIHYDRWWNPAVENQATDRAFRIGQMRGVIVHKFITQGTVEERIDAMLEEKSAMFQEVITASGEAWITEMGDKELLDLFTLRM